jgi:GLPGLI family protein
MKRTLKTLLKSLLILTTFSISGVEVFAQDILLGKVTYQKKEVFEIKGLEDLPENMKTMMPTDRKTNHELLFSNEASLYQNAKNVDNDVNISQDMGGGNEVQIQIREPESYLYYDYEKKEIVEETEFMSRRFLITTPTDTVKWQIVGSQKEIIGYKCIEAKLVGSDEGLKAWFTPEIPVSTGPDSYTGLPGLILGLSTEKGDLVIEASTIEMGQINPKDITKPKKGKKVSHTEFAKIRAEKMKEMEEATGGHMMIIQIEE